MAKKKSKHPGSKLVSDFELWARVSKTIEPINAELARELASFEKLVAPHVGSLPKPTTRPAHPIKANQSFLRNSVPPALTGIDKRQGRRLLRGKVEIDARLDLHGENLESAHHRLFNFLSDCSTQSYRTVLVITGKGDSAFTRHTLHSRDFHQSSQRSGKLRTALPDWLNENRFRELVTGFQPAHPKHGGGGAVYIKLRNLNKGNRF